jgi:hypothetical protein
LEGDGDEVLSKIASGGVDKETLAHGALNGDGRECSDCCVVTRIGFCCCRGLEDAACTGDRDGVVGFAVTMIPRLLNIFISHLTSFIQASQILLL